MRPSIFLSLLFFLVCVHPNIINSRSDVPRTDYFSTEAGVLVDNVQDSLTVGVDGPDLFSDQLLIERLAIQNRERIPERTVHARGFLATGEFVVTNPMSNWTSASFLSTKGKVTPVAVRFSTVVHPRGSPEFLRDPRGFAVKFYTDAGNYDLVGINFPVFFIRDGIRFPELVRSLKPDPLTGIQQYWRIFDFLSHYPESLYMLTFLLDDVGIPRSYRYMNGNGVHTYKWLRPVGATTQQTYVRYHWDCLQGEQSLLDNEAILMDPSFATYDLYNATQNGDYPQWKLQVQLLPVQSSYPNLPFDPLDPTVEWPADMIPMIDVGILTLNATGHDFLDNEQSAFAPSRFVPGIAASNDKLLQARLFSYTDAQRYRLGINYNALPRNAPRCPFYPPQIDGKMNFLLTKEHDHINYFPSNYSVLREAPPQVYDNAPVSGVPVRQPITKFDDYTQPRARYLNFTADRQDRFAQRIAQRLSEDQVTFNLLNWWLTQWGIVDYGLEQAIKSYLSPSKIALLNAASTKEGKFDHRPLLRQQPKK
jgi:catalase